MKKNMGSLDRIIRAIVAVAIFLLYYNGLISGLTGIVLFIVAFVFALTAIIGVCPIYSLMRISTKRLSGQDKYV